MLFTLSQIQILQSEEEWGVVLKIFKKKMLNDYDQEKVIKGITSFSVAQITGEDDFWFDTFDIIN
jgi:hypothetical protein